MMPALLALFLFFSACHKDAMQESPKPVTQKSDPVPVQFSVADFLWQYETLPGGRRNPDAARDSSLGKINYITYQAIKDNIAVSTIHQDSLTPAADFGRIRDTLLPGHYIFRFLAYTHPLRFDSTLGTLRGFGHEMGENNVLDPIGDIFVAAVAYSVSPDSPAIVHAQKLERMVGKVVLNIKDAEAIYQQNYDIEIFIYPTWQFYYWDGGTAPNPLPYNSLVPRTGARTFEAFLFPSGSPSYQVWINVRNKQNGEVVLARPIPGVTISPNRKTILTGSLFGPTAWDLHLNDEWDDDIDMEF